MLLFFMGERKVKRKLPKGERKLIGKLAISSFLNPPYPRSSVLRTGKLCMAFNCK